MTRQFWLDLARRGACFPIATDLDLHEEAEPEAVRADPGRMGAMLARSARRYGIPMAMPLMDLRLDKAALLAPFGWNEQAAETYQFTEIPDSAPEVMAPADARAGAIAWLRTNTGLAPVGLAIGPFSLATRLMRDPISAVALAGEGEMGDPMVRLWEWCLARARAVVRRSLEWQVEAGARTMILCEPAVSSVYLSPRQIKRGSPIFADYALAPMREVKQLLSESGVSLFLHDCGELTQPVVQAWAADVHPAVLSLGSSRKLWEDEALVPDDVVMYGNLPSKLFYSDDAMPSEEVARRAAELRERMGAARHPFILGSECDVLHVPDCAERIRRKVEVWCSFNVEVR